MISFILCSMVGGAIASLVINWVFVDIRIRNLRAENRRLQKLNDRLIQELDGGRA